MLTGGRTLKRMLSYESGIVESTKRPLVFIYGAFALLQAGNRRTVCLECPTAENKSLSSPPPAMKVHAHIFTALTPC